MRSDTLVIIPAYNEEDNISNVILSVRKIHPEMDVAVIDDGSSDATVSSALRAGAHVLSHPFNMGYGVALQTGYKYAVLKGYGYVVQADGDGQHDMHGIDALIGAVKNEEADIALGSRFLGRNEYKTSIYRLTGIRLFSIILRLFSGQRIGDVTTGFQAMNRKVLDVFISDMFPYDYPDADVILLMSGLGFRIKEVPVTMYPNSEGKSMHRSPIDALYYIFKMVLSMFLTKLRKY